MTTQNILSNRSCQGLFLECNRTCIREARDRPSVCFSVAERGPAIASRSIGSRDGSAASVSVGTSAGEETASLSVWTLVRERTVFPIEVVMGILNSNIPKKKNSAVRSNGCDAPTCPSETSSSRASCSSAPPTPAPRGERRETQASQPPRGRYQTQKQQRTQQNGRRVLRAPSQRGTKRGDENTEAASLSAWHVGRGGERLLCSARRELRREVCDSDSSLD